MICYFDHSVKKIAPQIVHCDENFLRSCFCLTFGAFWCIIIKLQVASIIYGGIAQLARVLGSYPIGRWFKSYCRYQVRALSQECDNAFWPVGQEVKTSPFHGGIMGSIPVRVTITQPHRWLKIAVCGFSFFLKNEFVRYLYATHIFQRISISF